MSLKLTIFSFKVKKGSSDSPFKGCHLRFTTVLFIDVDDEECIKHPKVLKVDYFQNVRYYKQNIRYCTKLFGITKKMFSIMKKMFDKNRKYLVLRIENVWYYEENVRY